MPQDRAAPAARSSSVKVPLPPSEPISATALMPAPSAVTSSVSRPQSTVAGKQLGGVGAGELDAAARSQPLGTAQERQLAGDAPAGEGAVDRLHCKLRLAEPQARPWTSRPASFGVSVTRADLSATCPRRRRNPASNGSAGQCPTEPPFEPPLPIVLVPAPALGVGIPTAMAIAAGRSTAPTSMSPSTVVGCCRIPMASRPPTLVPATVPSTSVNRSVPSDRASRAFTDAGSRSAGRPAATGRGERILALATLSIEPGAWSRIRAGTARNADACRWSRWRARRPRAGLRPRARRRAGPSPTAPIGRAAGRRRRSGRAPPARPVHRRCRLPGAR